MKPKVAILFPDPFAKTIAAGDRGRLLRIADVVWEGFQPDPAVVRRMLAGCSGCITGWGSIPMTGDVLDAAPRLSIIAHAAGTVKNVVSEAVWERGVRVTSAAAALGIGVAEFTLGVMICAMKRVPWLQARLGEGGWLDPGEEARIKEFYGATIGVVGAGHSGKNLIRLLRNFEAAILVYDPFLSARDAVEMGAEKVELLDDLVPRVDVLSIHAPNLPHLRHMFNRKTLGLLRDGAILINTARGALVDEEALAEELKTGRFTACLDVFDPEPPAADSPLRKLANVILTPHIAGCRASNIFRQGRYAVTELERFFAGQPAVYPVTQADLSRMA